MTGIAASRGVPWSAGALNHAARGVSVSRRTDVPALFGEWFSRRLDQGFAEYVPLGPPRRIRCSLLPPDVTHFNFWSKWPRPFFRVLERVLGAGYPVLWNVTVTGLGGTAVEPGVPAPDRAVAVVAELARLVPPSAIAWRYDPVFVSSRFDAEHHRQSFARLLDGLAGHVDRAIISFPTRYRRQVDPDLAAYARETGDQPADLDLSRQVDLAAELAAIAATAGLPLQVCCMPELALAAGLQRAGCNSFDWPLRVYPALARHRRLRRRATRKGCTCSEEVDIGAYDTCILGCRYSYGSCNLAVARRNFARHDPDAPSLLP